MANHCGEGLQGIRLMPTSPLISAFDPAIIKPGTAGSTVALAKVSDVGGNLAVNLAIAVGILVATIWLANWAAKLTTPPSAAGRVLTKT